MDPDKPDSWRAFSDAVEALSSITDPVHRLSDLVPPAEKVITAIEADPSKRAVHAATICSLMRPDYEGAWEALAYLMYRLRWPEIRRRAETGLQEERLRMAAGQGSEKAFDRWMEDIIAADNDLWEERRLWLHVRA